MATDGGPEVARDIHWQCLHIGCYIFKTMEHGTACWEVLLVIETLDNRGKTSVDTICIARVINHDTVTVGKDIL